MKMLKRYLIEQFFPGTYEEYLESKEMNRTEAKVYKKNPKFVIGWILFAIPILYMAIWGKWWLALPIIIGVTLIRDTISEHYCSLLNKGQKNESNQGLHSIAESARSER